MKLWKDGEFMKLYNEAYALQQRLAETSSKNDLTLLSRKFWDMMQKGNINGCITLLTDSMRGRLLPINEEMLLLLQKNTL